MATPTVEKHEKMAAPCSGRGQSDREEVDPDLTAGTGQDPDCQTGIKKEFRERNRILGCQRPPCLCEARGHDRARSAVPRLSGHGAGSLRPAGPPDPRRCDCCMALPPSRLMEPNEPPQGMLNSALCPSGQDGQPLPNLRQPQALPVRISENAGPIGLRYDHVLATTGGSIRRYLPVLEKLGAAKVFGRPVPDLGDLLSVSGDSVRCNKMPATDGRLARPGPSPPSCCGCRLTGSRCCP